MPSRPALSSFLCTVALALIVAVAPAQAQSGGPDAFGYSYNPAALDYVPLVGNAGATRLTAGDDSSIAVTLPWAFSYYGNSYTAVFVNSNGALRFASTSATYLNTCGGTGSTSVPDLRPFWDDLYLPSAGDLHTWHDVANDRFIVSWQGVHHFDQRSGDGVSFQVQLRPSGTIEFHWLDLVTGNVAQNHGATATIGIADLSGGTNLSGNVLEISCNAAAPSLQGGAVRFALCNDVDQDGAFDINCAAGIGDDCDDNNGTVFPGATELCDGLDNDCDPATSELLDNDGDTVSACAGDCDDTDILNFPGNAELCDGQDNDCDGLANDDPQLETDGDADGSLSCADCDDGAPDRFPGNNELCDGIDNDCDNVVPTDEVDTDGDFTLDCGDCDELDPLAFPGAPELCDGIDQNCDGLLVAVSGPSGPFEFSSTAPSLTRGVRWSVPASSSISEIQAFLAIPNGSALTWQVWESQTDVATGYAVIATTTTLSSGGSTHAWRSSGDLPLTLTAGRFYAMTVTWTATTDYQFTTAIPLPQTYPLGDLLGGVAMSSGGAFATTPTVYGVRVSSADESDGDGDGALACGDDCDDNDGTVFGGAPELCDVVDNDCDGVIPPEELDGDADGFLECVNDCNDANPLIYPGRLEICDGVDQDCDALIDELFDLDGDGFFAGTNAGCIATYPNNTDCNDNAPGTYPGAPEFCDAIDSDCDFSLVDNFVNSDGDTDPDCIDTDDDNDGDPDTTDCATTNPAIHAGATEICDAIDQDCDGDLVEGFANNDGDLVPDCADPDDDNDGVDDGLDCARFDSSIYPGAPELCDGIDSNCNNSLVDAFLNTDGDLEPNCIDDDDDNDGDPDTSDCNTTNPAIFTGATELCDLIDQDCDGDLVEGYANFDGDLQPDCGDLDDDNDGDPDVTDCNDANSAIYTGATELCDLIDQDCDTDVIESFGDLDSDGIPDCVDTDADGDGFSGAVDCDDLDATIFPAATESCDTIDSDCDGSLVDGALDTDGDLVPNCVDDDDDDDGVSDADEALAGSNPLLADTDGDGVGDFTEIGLDPSAPLDSDDDGLWDYEDEDDDDDGIPTSVEVGDPNDPVDSDGDETPDYLDDDSDGDSMLDVIEGAGDPDGDAVPSYLDDDSDGNGIDDPTDGDGDADADGIPDFLDVDDTDGPDGDPDGDGLTNAQEDLLGSDPQNEDTDGDGVLDGDEPDGDTDGDGIPDILDPTDDTPGDDDDSAGDDDDATGDDDDSAGDDDDATGDDDDSAGDDDDDDDATGDDDDDTACACEASLSASPGGSALATLGVLAVVGRRRRR